MNNFVISFDDFLILGTGILLLILNLDYLASKKKDLQIFSFFAIFAFIVQIICYVTALIGIRNLFLFHIYAPIEFLLLGYMFYKWEADLKSLYQSVIAVIFSILLIFAIFQPWNSIPVYLLIVESLTLTILACRAIFTHKDKVIFIISFGVLFFFCQNSIAYYQYLQSNSALPLIQLTYIEIITNVLFITGMLYDKR